MARKRRAAAPVIAAGVDQPSDALITVLNTAFEGYLGGSLELDRAGFQQLLVRQQADLSLSRVALEGEVPIAVGLVARRGWTSRLAIMGVHPDARGRGVGTALTQALVDEAKERGDRRYELEVIEQNETGVRLYRKAGFETHQQLLEFRHPPIEGDPPGAPPPLQEIDVAEAAGAIAAQAEPDLPWPVTGESLTQLGPPVKAYRLGSTHAIVDVPASGPPTRPGAFPVARASRQPPEARLARSGQLPRALCPLLPAVWLRAGRTPTVSHAPRPQLRSHVHPKGRGQDLLEAPSKCGDVQHFLSIGRRLRYHDLDEQGRSHPQQRPQTPSSP